MIVGMLLIFLQHVMQQSFAFVKAVDKRAFMQISKEIIEGLYQTQLL